MTYLQVLKGSLNLQKNSKGNLFVVLGLISFVILGDAEMNREISRMCMRTDWHEGERPQVPPPLLRCVSARYYQVSTIGNTSYQSVGKM